MRFLHAFVGGLILAPLTASTALAADLETLDALQRIDTSLRSVALILIAILALHVVRTVFGR